MVKRLKHEKMNIEKKSLYSDLWLLSKRSGSPRSFRASWVVRRFNPYTLAPDPWLLPLVSKPVSALRCKPWATGLKILIAFHKKWGRGQMTHSPSSYYFSSGHMIGLTIRFVEVQDLCLECIGGLESESNSFRIIFSVIGSDSFVIGIPYCWP